MSEWIQMVLKFQIIIYYLYILQSVGPETLPVMYGGVSNSFLGFELETDEMFIRTKGETYR